MRAWTDRPQVEAAMLNPALFAAILSVGARGFEGRAGEPPVWLSGFLIPPLTLHRPTREALPKTVATHLASWVTREPLVRAGFPQLAKQLTPLTMEGLRVGLRAGILTFEDGRLRGTLGTPSAEGDLRDILRAADLVGRWLTKLDQPSSAFALLGVRP